MRIRTFVLKIINNERKILHYHEIIDRMTEKIVSVITQVCKKSKLLIHATLRRPRFSFPYSNLLTFVLQIYGP